MNEEIEQLASKHANAFKQISELEGIVIRGQVMVEMAINHAILDCVSFPNEYKSEKFSFSQIVILGHMLGICTPFKAELNALNKLRNQIAHGTSFDDKYIRVIISEIKQKNAQIIQTNKPLATTLATAISFICGAISAAPELANTQLLIKRLQKRIHLANEHPPNAKN